MVVFVPWLTVSLGLSFAAICWLLLTHWGGRALLIGVGVAAVATAALISIAVLPGVYRGYLSEVASPGEGGVTRTFVDQAKELTWYPWGWFSPTTHGAARAFLKLLSLGLLALAAAAFGLCAWLLRSRPGYYWQAIRENEEAAQALGIDVFKWKMLAMMVSAAMTALAGVFMAFYYNNIFPENIFHIGRSIEIILGPIIGGMGTLFGPIIGAAVLTLLADGLTEALNALGWQFPGLKQLIYGVVLLIVVAFRPQGIWPPLARKLKLPQ
jgi:branched-chain amino acid transport system permease protein